MSSKGSSLVEAVLVLGILAILLSAFGYLRVLTYESNIPCTLVKAENVRSGDSSHYRVFCEEETLDIKDDLVTGNFRSSDLYGQVSAMDAGTKLYFDGYGARIGPLSWKRRVFRMRVAEVTQ